MFKRCLLLVYFEYQPVPWWFSSFPGWILPSCISVIPLQIPSFLLSACLPVSSLMHLVNPDADWTQLSFYWLSVLALLVSMTIRQNSSPTNWWLQTPILLECSISLPNTVSIPLGKPKGQHSFFFMIHPEPSFGFWASWFLCFLLPPWCWHLLLCDM